tara:strand:- start:1813 stop:1923 length:111 start_codon:yes stop_codon:yes gene_type:complete
MKKNKTYKIKKNKSFMDVVIRGAYKFFESPFKRSSR